jgi:3-oxoacyl-[acyl-carrier protein] reductase
MALAHLTKHLAQLLAPDRILVNSISPGTVHTEGWDLYIQHKAEQEGRDVADVAVADGARVSQSMPLGRLGTPAEIAAAVLFLASPSSSFMTGADLAIDGGKIKSL